MFSHQWMGKKKKKRIIKINGILFAIKHNKEQGGT